MAAARNVNSRRVERQHGSVLLLVLVVVAILTLGTATYLELMQNELQAVRRHGRQAQALRLAESGAEYVKSLVALTPEELQLAGGLLDNPKLMQAVIVDDPSDEFDRGRFTILAPAQSDGLYSGARFGLENESAKLNVNALLAPGAEDRAIDRLLALPGMTLETAEAIVDWLDPDDAARLNGAESEYYRGLQPGYSAQNGPIADIEELLLVKGVTPELLYGLDQNRNLLVDEHERPRGLLAELDNADGSMNRGWSAYLTTSSVESMAPAAGTALVDLNGSDLQKLYNDLKPTIGDDQAKFLVLYRQYGALPMPQESGGAGSQTSTGRPGGSGATPGGAPMAAQGPGGTSSGAAAGGPGGGNQQPSVEVSVGAVQLKFEQPASQQLSSPLALVGATVQIPGENNGPPQNVKSPWLDEAGSYRDLLTLYDVAKAAASGRVAGRVNINAASRPVLRSIPDLPDDAVGKIVSRRELEPDRTQSDQRHAIWLLIEGIVTLEEMQRLERYITVGGDVFSGQAVGFFDAGQGVARGEFLV
ncbi:MAG: hypothetical protein DCC67_20955, partial [Planctomycetota bacterium]